SRRRHTRSDRDWSSDVCSSDLEQICTQASVVGRLVLQFGDEALLHHLVLSNGVIFDFFVQSTIRRPTQEPLLILGCRSEAFERRSEEHTSDSSHDQISYAVFCL